MEINIGIAEQDRAAIAEGLSRLLADTYTLYLKTHTFHWNVTGPMFNTLHLMFEAQYTELSLAVDAIAERIRALGFPAPGTYAAYARLSSIKEEDVEIDGKRLVLRLDEPVITSGEILSYKAYDEKDGLFNEVTTEDTLKALELFEKDLRKQAAENGIIEKAKENAEKTIEGLFMMSGYEQVKIDWR